MYIGEGIFTRILDRVPLSAWPEWPEPGERQRRSSTAESTRFDSRIVSGERQSETRNCRGRETGVDE